MLILVLVSFFPVHAQDVGPDETPVRFDFHGNDSITSRDLVAIVDGEREAYRKSSYHRSVLDDAAFMIERHYRSKGYYKVRVEFLVDAISPTLVTFNIEENDLWKTTGPVRFDPVIEVPGFDQWWKGNSAYARPGSGLAFFENEFLNDLDAAGSWLRSQGYLDVKMTVEKSEDDSNVEIVVVTELGPCTFLGELTFSGTPIVSTPVLLAKIGLSPWPTDPVPFNTDLVTDWKDELEKQYEERGYFRPVITDSVVYLPLGEGKKTAHVTLEIEPGVIHSIRDIIIAHEDDLITQRWIIDEAFEVRPGDLYDRSCIEKGKTRLLGLEVFSRVQIVPEKVEGTDSGVDLFLILTEKHRFSLGLGLGTGILDPVRAGIELDWVNVLGTATTLEFRASLTRHHQRAELNLIDPAPFMDPDNHFQIGPFAVRQERPMFDLHRIGGAFEFSRTLAQGLVLGGGYTFEYSDLRHLGDLMSPHPEEDLFFSGPKLIFGLDRRDDPNNPASGFLFFERIETSFRALAGEEDLLGSTSRLELYHSFFDFREEPFIFASSVDVRLIRPILESNRVPIQKRIFEGGEHSVRSFEEDRMGPLNRFNTPEGGEFSIVATLELRFHIWSDFWGVLFLDAGTVERRLEDFPERKWDYALGVGIRSATPIGLLRIEVAFNPDPDWSADEDLAEFIFALGFNF